VASFPLLLLAAGLVAAPPTALDRVVLISIDDHAGHAKEHGTNHPEDGRRPLALRSDRLPLPVLGGAAREITGLRPLLAPLLIGARR
jgi:hypothetical protein